MDDVIRRKPATSGEVTEAILIIGGIVLIIGGTILATTLKAAAERDAHVQEYIYSFDNLLIDVPPNLTGMWIGIVVAILGALMLIGALVARAARGGSERRSDNDRPPSNLFD